MKKLGLLAGVALITFSTVGTADAQRWRGGGWRGGGGWNGGYYRGGGWGYRGGGWGNGGAVAAGLIGGALLGGLITAAATPAYGYGYPGYGYGYGYPGYGYRYGYGYGGYPAAYSYPAYSYPAYGYYSAPVTRVVYRPAPVYGTRVVYRQPRLQDASCLSRPRPGRAPHTARRGDHGRDRRPPGHAGPGRPLPLSLRLRTPLKRKNRLDEAVFVVSDMPGSLLDLGFLELDVLLRDRVVLLEDRASRSSCASSSSSRRNSPCRRWRRASL